MPTKPKLADPGVLIRDGKLRTDTFRACMDPDLIAEHDKLTEERERLVEQRDSAQATARDSLAARAHTPELDAQIADIDTQVAELEKAIEAVTVVLTLEALPRPKFRALMDKHPPRKDAEGKLTHPRDIIGVAYEPFFDNLLRLAIVEPKLDEETLDLLLDARLTDSDWERLTDVAWALNRATVNVPFSQAVSPSRRNSSPR